MKFKLTGRPRIPIREIPCKECGNVFGQTANEKRKMHSTCPACTSITRKPTPDKPGRPKNYLEVVLPKSMTPHLDKKRGEWYMRVRVRKSRSGEPFKFDRVYLGVGADADKETVGAAFSASYARQEMAGALRCTPEQTKKKQKRIYSIRHDIADWKQGRDKDLGLKRIIVRKAVYTVHLPDPMIDGKKHYLGQFPTRTEARIKRDEFYREIKHKHVPCAVCGRLPAAKQGFLSHLTADCPNRVRIPQHIRPLFQAKLWNLRFSTGEDQNTERLTHEDLYYMGYMYKAARGFRYFTRNDVEYDFSLAAKYAKERPPVVEEDTMFE